MIAYTASALRDIEQAFNWYEDKQEGLGDRFIADVRETARRIEANPKGYAPAIGEARKALLRKFPYAMYFKVNADGSLVIACLHSRRDARLAKERAAGITEIPKPPEPS